jgi:hypothetical protein
MKFNRNFSRIAIFALILICNIAQIYLAKENTNRSKANRFHAQYKSMVNHGAIPPQYRPQRLPKNKYTQQKIGLKAFNLNGQGQLITRCPKFSVLVKLIFQKRNDYILDVGFNCRRDYKNISDDEITLPQNPKDGRITSDSFDSMTPPNIECPAGRALSGYEWQRMNKITYFKYYCTKVKNMHDQQTIKEKYYPTDLSTLDPMEKKALSRFLPHTDITVNFGKYISFGINSIKFSRTAVANYQQTKIPGTLSYQFTISKIGALPPGSKQNPDSNFDRSNNP